VVIPSREQVHAEQERKRSAAAGGIPVARLRQRSQATVVGTLRSVTLRPRAGVPALEAELYDGTGTLTLIWLGRRQIAGVTPGRRLRIHGLVTEVQGEAAVYNPRYELLVGGGG
jgi:RecG-like helicase